MGAPRTGGSSAEPAVSLPVLSVKPNRKLAKSRTGKWRALVLALVHVVIVIHIIQWLITGMTLSPIEPSESMETLELGRVNAGFVFFFLAIVATFVAGRYVCGWACHMIAAQDICTWMMTRLGVRPKPFRSRLLVWAPLVLGFYMFVWPTVKREVLKPGLEAMGVEYPVWLAPAHEIPGIDPEFIIEDYWATFPPWFVAIPFLLVCGFATVYFLGSKGFCTYGCPYGGLFGVADRFAPVRVRVNDNCQHCGHCTAACTSNVRVHEEVAVYGMVVDPGCMKTMDCISVCPNNALSIRVGKPSILARPRGGEAREKGERFGARRTRRYELSWAGELLAAGVLVLLFMSFRGLLNMVPLLMAIGMAGVGTAILVFAAQVLTRPSVRLQNIQLRLKGKIRVGGLVVLALAAMTIAGGVWGGHARYRLWRATSDYNRIDAPLGIVLRPDFAPSESTRMRARSALRNAGLADSPGRGGWGWRLSPDDENRVAYLQLVLGKRDQGERTIREVIERGNPHDDMVMQAAGVLRARGAAPDELIELYQQAIDLHPKLWGPRRELAGLLATAGRSEEALAVLVDAPRPPSTSQRQLAIAQLTLTLGDSAGTRSILGDLHEAGLSVDELSLAARLWGALGESARAMALVEASASRAQELADQAVTPRERVGAAAGLVVAASLQAEAGNPERGLGMALRAVDLDPESVGPRRLAGRIMLVLGKTRESAEHFRSAIELLEDQPWDLFNFGAETVNVGFSATDQDVARLGVDAMARAMAARPDEPIMAHDLAMALRAIGENDRAGETIVRAAELAPDSAILARRAAELLRSIGDADRADAWDAVAAGRLRPDD